MQLLESRLFNKKLDKIFKHGKLAMLKIYKEIFNSKFNIRFQFDMYW